MAGCGSDRRGSDINAVSLRLLAMSNFGGRRDMHGTTEQLRSLIETAIIHPIKDGHEIELVRKVASRVDVAGGAGNKKPPWRGRFSMPKIGVR